jgi:hypothetical protein
MISVLCGRFLCAHVWCVWCVRSVWAVCALVWGLWGPTQAPHTPHTTRVRLCGAPYSTIKLYSTFEISICSFQTFLLCQQQFASCWPPTTCATDQNSPKSCRTWEADVIHAPTQTPILSRSHITHGAHGLSQKLTEILSCGFDHGHRHCNNFRNTLLIRINSKRHLYRSV